jgi:hypothetical protein
MIKSPDRTLPLTHLLSQMRPFTPNAESLIRIHDGNFMVVQDDQLTQTNSILKNTASSIHHHTSDSYPLIANVTLPDSTFREPTGSGYSASP